MDRPISLINDIRTKHKLITTRIIITARHMHGIHFRVYNAQKIGTYMNYFDSIQTEKPSLTSNQSPPPP